MKKTLSVLAFLIVIWPTVVSAHAGHVHSAPDFFPIYLIPLLFIILSLELFFFKQSIKHLTSLLLIAGIIVFSSSSSVSAASVTVSGPNGGECLKGGSSISITWSESGNDHMATYYRTDGGTPNYSSDTGGLISHPVSGSSQSWTVPSVTVSTARIWVEGHNAGHSPLAIDSSNSNFSIDNSAPSASTVSQQNKTSSSVTLSWTSSSDSGCEGLTGYKVLRNDSVITTVGSGTTSYTDSNLSAGTAYSYKVQAYDSFHSTDSNTLSVTTDSASSQTSSSGGTSSTATPTPTSTKSSTTTSSKSSSSPTSASSTKNTSSATLKASGSPVESSLSSVTIDELEIPASAADALKIAQGQTLLLSGQGIPNSTQLITLYSEPKSSEVLTDANGQWRYSVSTADTEPGEHYITIKPKDSEIAEKEIFRFTLVPKEMIAEAKQTQKKPFPWPWLIGALLILSAASIGGYVWYRRRKNSSMNNSPKMESTSPT